MSLYKFLPALHTGQAKVFPSIAEKGVFLDMLSFLFPSIGS